MHFSLATIATTALILSVSAAPHRSHGKDRNNTDTNEQSGKDAGRGHYSDGTFPSGVFGSRSTAAPTGGVPDFGGKPSEHALTAVPTARLLSGADLSTISFELPSSATGNFIGISRAKSDLSDSNDSNDDSSDSNDSKDSSGDSKDKEKNSSDDKEASGGDESTSDSSSPDDNEGNGGDESTSDDSSSDDKETSSSSEDNDSPTGSGDEQTSSGSGGDESSSDSDSDSDSDSGSGSGSGSSGSSNSTIPSTPSSGGSTASGTFPTAAGESTLSKPMEVTDFDGGMVKFGRGVSCSSGEGGDSDAVFIVADGGSLSNVIIGADQIEGVHCAGACTITNVWWEAVCEDALSFKGNGDGTVSGGGAKGAQDKVVQHNGVGTISISDFYVEDFGKLYRSCGNCKTVSPFFSLFPPIPSSYLNPPSTHTKLTPCSKVSVMLRLTA